MTCIIQESRILDLGSWIQDPVSWIQGIDPGSRILDPGYRIMNPGSRILDPRSRTVQKQKIFSRKLEYWNPQPLNILNKYILQTSLQDAVERKPQLALEDSAPENPTKTMPAKAPNWQEWPLVPVDVGEDEANNEEKPIMLPSRGQCQCTHGCKKRPGTRTEWTSCHQLVGPCCWMPGYRETRRICHMCAVIPEPDPEQLQREQFQKVMRMHEISRMQKTGISFRPGWWPRIFHLVDGTLGFPFC